MRVVLLTGSPGVGKTTMVRGIANDLVMCGLRVGGIITSEIRASGVRSGFRIADLSTGREGWLARRDPGLGSRIGSYRILNEDLEEIGVEALRRAASGGMDFAIVDEIGPMEMTSAPFRSALQVFDGAQPTLATVRLGSDYDEVEKIRTRCLQLMLTKDNREQVHATLVHQIDSWIGSERPRN